MATTVCPVCRDVTVSREIPHGLRTYFDCESCGYFAASSSVLGTALTLDARRLSPVQYAALSHRIRQMCDQMDEAPLITTDTINRNELRLPSPAVQASNIIRYFGDQVAETGEPAKNPAKSFTAKIGAPNRAAALRIVRQLADAGSLMIANRAYQSTADEPDGIDLTLQGWEIWENEKRGKFAGRYGFMALKFGDKELDDFQRTVIKPATLNLGFVLEDMRDAAKAGIIDNVMREKIRDAAFVLVDLTHANLGAYWEAGYAEGLGKPVLYLCKKSVFSENGTHFDTNHCTTVMWDAADHQAFVDELTATLRRSLGLFE